MTGLLKLDDDAALDAGVVGVKAAHLAHARAAGLPTLPGLIVPEAAGRPAVRAGRAALEARGLGAARGAVTGHEISADLLAALSRTAELGDKLAVRSSSRLDDSGALAGALASYLEVRPGELATAVRGCWASVFAPQLVARLDNLGIAIDDVGPAVLIQPHVNPEAGGWARLAGDCVEIAVVAGSPAPLLAGRHPGQRVTVTADGSVVGGPPDDNLDPAVLALVADLARRAGREVRGATRMEWAIVDGSPVVLQLSKIVDHHGPGRRPTGDFSGRAYDRLARATTPRRGRLADGFLAPWAAAFDGLPPASVVEAEDGSAALFERAALVAVELRRAVGAAAQVPPEEIAGRLARGDPELANGLADVDVDAGIAAWLLGALETTAQGLVHTGWLRTPDELWRYSADSIMAALGGHHLAQPARWLGDRWDDMLFAVAATRGEMKTGVPASAGRAAGRAIVVRGPDDAAAMRDGDVMVATWAIPNLSPLLWRVSALVTVGGSPAAHLCEVARALHVPAVVAAGVTSQCDGGMLAVDGETGEVWQWSG